MRTLTWSIVLGALPVALGAQTPQQPPLTDAQQIASAALPLPVEFRADARVLPTQPVALYSLTGPAGSFDAATGTVSGARALSVIYIAGATTASTGLPARPMEGAPWLMFPGTPKAHIMLVPKM